MIFAVAFSTSMTSSGSSTLREWTWLMWRSYRPPVPQAATVYRRVSKHEKVLPVVQRFLATRF
jgi:hypothetical protein